MPRLDKNNTLTLSDAIKVTRPRSFLTMLKPIGPVCNLNCTYCYYLEKERLYESSSTFKMDDDLLEDFTRQFIEGQEVPVVTFTWQGGEPTLLGIGFFEKALAFQKKYQGNKRIENAFQTNGTRINEDWCRFFSKNQFLVGISIDGPKEIHDHYRKYKSGQPSFDQVMTAIRLMKRFRVEFNTLTVINDRNATRPLDVYRFLRKNGSGYQQYIPIVEREAGDIDQSSLRLVAPNFAKEAEATPWTVRARQYGRFMTQIFNEWVRNDVGKVFVQLFDVTLANWVGAPPGLCVFAETCGDATVMEHNGDVYSCDHFVYSDYLLGNIHEHRLIDLVGSTRQVQFGKDKRDTLPRYCLQCDVRFACHGGCLKHRTLTTPDGQPGLNWLCEGYKLFFNHVRPYMDFMSTELANQRPPANVMRWARTQPLVNP